MKDLFDALFPSESVDSLIAKVKFYYILDQYPWLPFLILLVIGIIVTLIVLVIRRKRQPSPRHAPAPQPAPIPEPMEPRMEPTYVISKNVMFHPPVKVSGDGRRLECISGVLKGKVFSLQGKMCIGRDPHKCQILFPEETKGVSRIHCSITFDGKHSVTVCDENSRCGTLIDGQPIIAGKAVPLHRGQKLSLGSQAHTFILKGHSAH